MDVEVRLQRTMMRANVQMRVPKQLYELVGVNKQNFAQFSPLTTWS